jgi:anti-sigma regulatory factor (Ser/Thr protein kinase)
MSEPLVLRYTVDGDDFAAAGEASSDMKRVLRRLGMDPELIRRAAICMYEGEINLVIHGGGGEATVALEPDRLVITLEDHGPGIADVEQAMREGYSTATSTVRDLGFGAGMGLPNMKRYADSITLTSEVGVGTKVVMTIGLTKT